MALSRLVLFDVDGTLLWPDGAGRASMKAALESVYGTAGPIESHAFGGRTDRDTVYTLLHGAGLPDTLIWERFDQFAVSMEAELKRRLALKLHDIRPCPGAQHLVSVLADRKDVLVGLVTGNLEPIAFLKLRAAGFDTSLFQVGAYGTESFDRAGLPPLAVERAARITGVTFRGKQIVIVGDTPADVTCGLSLGARSIAVGTGWCERAELEAVSPDFYFQDLSDVEAVLEAIFSEFNAG
jgi:phosphoglycolate phosphatase-like HAD superfamily hydrolase